MIVSEDNMSDAIAPVKLSGRKIPTRPCELCGNIFKPNHNSQGRFCSNECSGKAKRMPVVARLMNYSISEPNSGCWIWTGNINRLGYGMIRIGKMRVAHRVSFEVFKGKIPDGLDIMHKCDVRCCINPDHLTPGTHLDNMRDMIAKGRNSPQCGEKHHGAKLNDEIVLLARRSGMTPKEFAIAYGVSKSAAARALNGETWSHLNDRV